MRESERDGERESERGTMRADVQAGEQQMQMFVSIPVRVCVRVCVCVRQLNMHLEQSAEKGNKTKFNRICGKQSQQTEPATGLVSSAFFGAMNPRVPQGVAHTHIQYTHQISLIAYCSNKLND